MPSRYCATIPSRGAGGRREGHGHADRGTELTVGADHGIEVTVGADRESPKCRPRQVFDPATAGD